MPWQLINLIDNHDYREIIVMTIMLTIIVMSIIHIEKGTRKYFYLKNTISK